MYKGNYLCTFITFMITAGVTMDSKKTKQRKPINSSRNNQLIVFFLPHKQPRREINIFISVICLVCYSLQNIFISIFSLKSCDV